MSEPCWIWQCEHTIPSRAGAGRKVRQEILRQLKQRKWGKHDVFSVHLALEEALVNAIRHGNALDAAKTVHVWCRMSDDLVRIEVTDQGNGFDPARLPDPTDHEHRDIPSGRGVLLMRRFMDRVEFNEQGNAVLLEKRRTPAAEQTCDPNQP
ncbi:MAG: ATP-binding protein [Pirellulales bacterium]|nr:ATP-binding protein [Pirellulales bacterium]